MNITYQSFIDLSIDKYLNNDQLLYVENNVRYIYYYEEIEELYNLAKNDINKFVELIINEYKIALCSR